MNTRSRPKKKEKNNYKKQLLKKRKCETIKIKNTKYFYKKTLLTAWECFVDEINRIDAIIDLHDILAECNDDDLEVLLGYNKSLKEENEEFKKIFYDIVSQLNAEIGNPNSVYSIKVIVDPKMFRKIKEICK